MKFSNTIIDLLHIIKRKGFIEFFLHVCNYVGSVVVYRLKIFGLRIRRYDIDYSVRLGGRNVFFQSAKNSIRIGKDSVVGFCVNLRAGLGGSIVIKKSVGIYDYTMIDIHNRLEIGENSLIAPFCYITDYDHVIKDKNKPIIEQGYITKPIVIGKNVWLGAKVIVLKGVKIGDNTIIGAGSVVTRNIPANSVAVGAPARVIKKIVNC